MVVREFIDDQKFEELVNGSPSEEDLRVAAEVDRFDSRTPGQGLVVPHLGRDRHELRNGNSNRPVVVLLLVLLLVWAVGIRVWYASHRPDPQRFWDEKWNIPNLHAVLEEGTLRPAAYQYLRLTYLPHAGVLYALAGAGRFSDPDFSWFEGQRLRPGGFLVIRLVQVCFGAVSILLTFFLGRRLFDAETGLLAAFLVAAAPLHVNLSGMFKPDVLLLAMILSAFWWSLGAVKTGRPSAYLLAGLGIGLALSSKPTGGVIAVPLTLAAAYLGLRDRRHWVGLVLAGATAVAVFVALNPYKRYLAGFESQQNFYREQAVKFGTLGDPVELTSRLLRAPSIGTHGVMVGLCVMAGFVMLSWRLWQRRGEPAEAMPLMMLLSFPIAFAIIYGSVAQVVLGQNMLPLLPFTSLMAASFLAAAWREVGARREWVGDARVVAVVVALFVLVPARRAHSFVYQELVPSTHELALRHVVKNVPRRGRLWIRWESDVWLPRDRRGQGPQNRLPAELMFWTAPDLSHVDPDQLRNADVEVLAVRPRDEDRMRFYRLRRQEAHSEQLIEPSLFRARGPKVSVLVHSWGEPRKEHLTLTTLNRSRFGADEDRRFTPGGSILRNNDLCRDVELPVGAGLDLRFGLNERRLRKQGRDLYAARFRVFLRGSGGSPEAAELVDEVLAIDAAATRRYLSVDLEQHAGTTASICIHTEVVGAPDEPTEGSALWERIRVLDRNGAPLADRFGVEVEASPSQEIAALSFYLQDLPPVTEPVEMEVDGRQLELFHSQWRGELLVTTERFPVPTQADAQVSIRLPESIDRSRLEMTLRRWPAGSPGPGG